MLLRKAVILTLAILFVFAALGLSSSDTQKMGAPELTIPAPAKGDVTFTHHKHQEALKDCTLCHSVFPQKAGAIADMKKKGELKKKQVMNKVCVKCHRERKNQGLSTGPTSCSKCHG